MGRTSGTSPNCIDQVDKYECRKLLSEDAQSAKTSDWSDSVLAAEATKAGSASEVTRLIPRPPSRTGRLACMYPLRKIGIGNLLDGTSQQSIKLAEGRMFSRWATSQEMENFWGAER